jgi:hypothetical protein
VQLSTHTKPLLIAFWKCVLVIVLVNTIAARNMSFVELSLFERMIEAPFYHPPK